MLSSPTTAQATRKLDGAPGVALGASGHWAQILPTKPKALRNSARSPKKEDWPRAEDRQDIYGGGNFPLSFERLTGNCTL